MDNDYLKHLAGSSQVDEGLGSQLAARAASTGQRFSAMTGGTIQDLDTTKIKSLYLSFIKKVKSVLQDFSEGNNSVATRLLQRKDISPHQRELINKINQMLIELDQEVRVAQGAVSRPYDQNDPTQSRTDAIPYKRPMPAKAIGKISEIVEGFFTRDFALNKALQTNNPSVIINAYTQKLMKLRSEFATDVSKVTKIPTSFIHRVLEKINPTYAKRYNDVGNIVDMSRPPVLPASTKATNPATAPTTTPSATPPPLPKTSSTPVAPSATGAASQPGQGSGQALANAHTIGGDGNDFAIFVGRVIDIIVDNVKEDTARSGPYFTDPETGLPSKLSTNYDQPAPHAKAPPGRKPVKVPPFVQPSPPSHSSPSADYSIEEADEPTDASTTPKDKVRRKSDTEDEEEVFYPGEFLYNFRSAWRKSTHASIELDTHGNDKVIMSKGKIKIIRVILSWSSGENSIIVKYKDSKDTAESTPWKEMVLFKFWDSDANYQSPSFKGNASIQTYIYNANPYEKGLFKGAAPAVIANLQAKTDEFNRSLYAIVHRKAMEFKRRPKGTFDLVMNDDGTIVVHGTPEYKQSKIVPYDKETISAFINSSDPNVRDPWIKSLRHIGYFKKFPEMEPKLEPNTAEAVKLISIERGIDEVEAEQIVKDAINKIGPTAINMSGPVLAAAVNKVSPTGGKPSVKFTDVPAANDAYQALVKMGIGGVTQKQLAAKMQSVVDAEGTGLSVDEYVAKVTAKPSPTGEPSSTSTTTTATPGPSPSPVVSVAPDTEPETTPETPTTPIEDVGKLRVNQDDGSVVWTKPSTGKQVKFTAAQLKNTASRKLWSALKKAGYPFDKFGVKPDVSETIINPFQRSNFL